MWSYSSPITAALATKTMGGTAVEDDKWILHWKGIAAHFNKSTKTVQAWHKCCPMPLKRTKTGSVAIKRHDLDVWFDHFVSTNND